jgi:putative ATPase
MRPSQLDRFYGQVHLMGEGKILSQFIKSEKLVSLIFWGPPGSGKTSLGFLLAEHFSFPCVFFSAVLSGIKEVKKVMAEAEDHRRLYGQPTVIFIDEIHRFHKGQQAAFLPYVERGDIILFGSTTENPSFEIIAPLLSRTKVLLLKPLDASTLQRILEEALLDKKKRTWQPGAWYQSPSSSKHHRLFQWRRPQSIEHLGDRSRPGTSRNDIRRRCPGSSAEACPAL